MIDELDAEECERLDGLSCNVTVGLARIRKAMRVIVAESHERGHVLKGRPDDLADVGRSSADAAFAYQDFLEYSSAARGIDGPEFFMVKVRELLVEHGKDGVAATQGQVLQFIELALFLQASAKLERCTDGAASGRTYAFERVAFF